MPILRSLLGKSEMDDGASARLRPLQGTSTAAGVSVTPERSLQVSAVYACVRLISGAISQLPVHIYRRTSDGRQRIGNHPLTEMLTVRPNPEMDSSEFVRTVVVWMLLQGNAIAYRQPAPSGRTAALWPILPWSVSPHRIKDTGEPVYKIVLQDGEYVPGFKPGVAQYVPLSRILHFRAFGLGSWGLSPIAVARSKIAVGYASEEYGAGFFKRGANPGGVLTSDSALSDTQFERLERQWKAAHGGFAKSNAPAILEGGVKWENVGLPPGDAQFLETQRYTSAAIAGHIFGVPPHMIGDVERSTSWGKGIAEQGIGFVRYTLMDWITRIERVMQQVFVSPDEYMRFEVAGLERGDMKARYDAYAVARQWGWMSADDVRRLEDEPPIKGGDVYLQPLNMVPAGSTSGEGRAARQARSTASRDRVAAQYAPLIADADRQVATLEQKVAAEILAEHVDESGRITNPTAFGAAIADAYAQRVNDPALTAFSPVLSGLADAIAREAASEIGAEPSDITAWVATYTKAHVGWRVMSAADRVAGAAVDGDAEAVTTVTTEAVEDRPEKTGRAEAVALALAVTRVTWSDAGVERLRWVTRGSETCKMCRDLDGKVVGIAEPFVAAGETLAGGDGQSDLHAHQPRFSPPLHPGCDCTIVSD